MPHGSGLPKSKYPKKAAAEEMLIVRSRKKMKQPTQKELAGMRQREIIRKNPRGTA